MKKKMADRASQMLHWPLTSQVAHSWFSLPSELFLLVGAKQNQVARSITHAPVTAHLDQTQGLPSLPPPNTHKTNVNIQSKVSLITLFTPTLTCYTSNFFIWPICNAHMCWDWMSIMALSWWTQCWSSQEKVAFLAPFPKLKLPAKIHQNAADSFPCDV